MQAKTFSKSSNLIAKLLYALPLLFFLLAYFLIITSGEDILQGANTPPNILQDSINAFHHSARLSDMWAWSIINFFHYRYSFGIDTFFRLFDVFLGFSLFYLITVIALQRKPQLKISDALLFNFSFLLVVGTIHGAVLYNGFSMIHNYLFIALSFLLFTLPFLYYWLHPTHSSPRWFPLVMFPAGIIFGLSSNLTPLAFLGTLFCLYLFALFRHKAKYAPLKFLSSWQFFALLGTIIGISISFFLGPGVNNYADPSSSYVKNFDYLPISYLLENPLPGLKRLVKHEIHNFRQVLSPLIKAFVLLIIFLFFAQKPLGYHPRPLSYDQRFHIVFFSLFAFFYLLCTSQLNAPVRVHFPAYLSLVIVLLTLAHHFFSHCTRVTSFSPHFSLLCLSASLLLIFLRTTFAISYQIQTAPVFDYIRRSDDSIVCVPRALTVSPHLLKKFGQEDFVNDWVTDFHIYAKKVVFCDKMLNTP